MSEWIAIMLPVFLVMVRTAAFVAVMPIFSWRALPWVVRAGLALLLTLTFASVIPLRYDPVAVHWLRAVVLIFTEFAIGLGLGLAARFAYMGIQQGGLMAARQMGFADAGVFDPVTGSQERPLSTFFQMIFALLFLSAGGHRLLVMIMEGSFRSFPPAGGMEISAMTGGLVKAGSYMLLVALKLAAPVLAGFLVIGALLALLARVLPEMNVLLASFPLRVGAGLMMAAAIMPTLDNFTALIARWMRDNLVN